MFKCLEEIKNLTIKSDSYLYIDVGAAIDAPNATEWILKDSNASILGIEPYKKI